MDWSRIIGILIFLGALFAFCLMIYGISYFLSWIGNMVKFENYKKIQYKKYPKYNEVYSFRDLPCKKNYDFAYFVMMDYDLLPRSANLIGAYILKWVKDDVIKIDGDNIIILKRPKYSGLMGYLFFKLEGTANSKNKNVVNIHDYSTCFNYKALKSEFNDFYDEEFNKIKDNTDYVSVDENDCYSSTDKLDEIAAQILGLKKFFNEFDNMSDKEVESIKIWDEYLIYAQLLGVADKVIKKLAVKLPSEQYSEFANCVDIAIQCSSAVYEAYMQEAKQNAGGYDAGGGGFSSGGGGGGSFGGGGGGGGFR